MNNLTREKLGKIIIIVAPSGTGKSTIIKKIKEYFRELHWSVSFTTRPKRKQEIDGKHYFFISREEFENKIQAGDFIEYAQVHGNFYGSSKGFVASKIENGYSILFDLDVQGSYAMKHFYGDNANIIFIAPPSLKVLENRLRKRGTEQEKTIRLRLKNAEKEILEKDNFDYCVVNDKLEEAYLEIKQIIEEMLIEKNKK